MHCLYLFGTLLYICVIFLQWATAAAVGHGGTHGGWTLPSAKPSPICQLAKLPDAVPYACTAKQVAISADLLRASSV